MRAWTDIARRTMIMALVAPCVVFARGDETTPQQAKTPTIALKTTPGERVAFRVHRGPYWSIGPQFTELYRYLTEHDLPGPMYARFLNEPGAVPIDALRTEIGFFVPDGFRPHESFRSDTHPPGFVAYMLFEEPSATRSHDLARLRRWIRKSGYMTSGPVTEIYHVYGGAGERETWRTEVQVPITVFQKPQGNAGATSSKIGATAESLPVEVESDLPKASRPSSAAPVRPTRSQESRTKTAPVSGTDSPSDRPSVTLPSSAPAPTRPEPAAVPSAQTFMNLGRFEELARTLMPKQAGSHPEDGVWRGQVVLRVVAVARGIVQMYSDNTDWAGVLAEALMGRFDTFVERLPVDPREQAIVTYESQPQSVVEQKQSIMRDLDRLLASIAGRAIEVEMARAALMDILQRVFDLDAAGAMNSLRRSEISP